MNFPILNISHDRWYDDDIMDYISFDEFIYTRKDAIFNELYKDQLFCDCDGVIFKAIKKAEMTQKWRNWLWFIPNVWKTEILFEPTHKKLTVDELRSYLLDRLAELTMDKELKKWEMNIRRATNHFELIYG
ncbi:hypothetical protein [uncultured Dokdonia sp.]|uniref:hypothetical protein n=1 Tax=uncultured Dokdonia sp. TaxID=575653 RepID=UPI002632F8A7|nr:hypothetical protein [uncultured Dokdonia sp.]